MFKISEFFAKLTFKVDTKGLDEFERRLRSLEQRVMTFDKRLQGKFDQIQKGLAKTQLAEKRALDIEKKKLQIAAQAQKNTLATLRIKEKAIQLDKKQSGSRGGRGLDSSLIARTQQRSRAWMADIAAGMAFGPDRKRMRELQDKFSVARSRTIDSAHAEALKMNKWRDAQTAMYAGLFSQADRAERDKLLKAENAFLKRREKDHAEAIRINKAFDKARIKEFQKQLNNGMAFGPDRNTMLRLRDRFDSQNSRRPRSPAGAAFGAGLGASAMSWGRGFIPGLGGAWAIAQLNAYSQELNGQQLALQAVTGSPTAAANTRRWLYKAAYEYGFSAPDVMPSFTKTLASFQGAGMNEPDARRTFEGTIAYTRTMGLSAEATKRVMLAIEQIANKTTVTMEELKRQMGDALPGVMSAMAEAVTLQTGKTTTPEQLIKLIEGGDVPASVLPFFGDVLMGRARSGGGLEAAKISSLAEQNRFKTDWALFVRLLGLSGMDSGMATIFRSMSGMLQESTPLVEQMGAGFDNMSISLSKMADNLGPKLIKGLVESLKTLNSIVDVAINLSEGKFKEAGKAAWNGISGAFDFNNTMNPYMMLGGAAWRGATGNTPMGHLSNFGNFFANNFTDPTIDPYGMASAQGLLTDMNGRGGGRNNQYSVQVTAPINVSGVNDPVMISERLRLDLSKIIDDALIGFPEKGS